MNRARNFITGLWITVVYFVCTILPKGKWKSRIDKYIRLQNALVKVEVAALENELAYIKKVTRRLEDENVRLEWEREQIDAELADTENQFKEEG